MTSTPSTREQLDRLVVVLKRALTFWKRGLAVFLVGALVAVPYVLTRERSYRSETLILYHDTISSDFNGGEGGAEGARRVGARLRELLLSRTSLEPIIKDLDLYPDKIIRGELIGAVEEMRKNIAFRARDGDTYEISFIGNKPALVQEVTRRLGDCIIRETAKGRADHAKTLKEFLDTESTRNETALKQQEAELASFLVLHPEFVARREGQGQTQRAPTDRPAAGGTSADPVLASLEARMARLDRQLNPKAGAPTTAKKPAALPDSAELLAARRDLADKQGRYTDKHPDVVAARNRLRAAEAAQAQANEAAAAAAGGGPGDDPGSPSSPMDEAALRKELASLDAQIAARRAKLATGAGVVVDAGARPASPRGANNPVELEVEFRRLQREVEDGRDRQQKLDQRLFRASIAASSVENDRNSQVSVLDPPYLPVRPVSKSRSMTLAGLLAVCLLLAIGTTVLSANLDDKIYDRRDLERLDVLPVLGAIPKQLPPARVVRRLPASTNVD